MLQAANTDLFNPFVPKAARLSVKIYHLRYKLIHSGFLFFGPSALMG